MIELFDKNIKIDYVSLIEQLKKNKKLEDIGGAYYITTLTEDAPLTHNIEYYANIIRDKSILRNIINVAEIVSSDAYDSKEDVTDILDKAEQRLFSLSQDADKKRFKKVSPILAEVLDNWGNRKEGLSGLASNFYDLDNSYHEIFRNNKVKSLKVLTKEFDQISEYLFLNRPKKYEEKKFSEKLFFFSHIL